MRSDETDVGPARSDNSAQQQRNPLRRQLNPPVMPHVQGNCHWCGRTYDEVALDALAAYAAKTENPGETVPEHQVTGLSRWVRGCVHLLQKYWPVTA